MIGYIVPARGLPKSPRERCHHTAAKPCAIGRKSSICSCNAARARLTIRQEHSQLGVLRVRARPEFPDRLRRNRCDGVDQRGSGHLGGVDAAGAFSEAERRARS
jgi:hypothetical protein